MPEPDVETTASVLRSTRIAVLASFAIMGTEIRRESGARNFPWPLMLLGILALCGALTEGAVGDWSGIYLSSDDLHLNTGIAASGFTVFSFSVAVGRAIGDRLTRRFGPIWVVRSGALLAALGLGIALITQNPVTGVLGFASMGVGLSCLVPQTMTATGNIDAAYSGANIARVGALSTVGNLLGPVLIGAIAAEASLPKALWVPVGLSIMVAIFANAVGPAGKQLPTGGQRN